MLMQNANSGLAYIYKMLKIEKDLSSKTFDCSLIHIAMYIYWLSNALIVTKKFECLFLKQRCINVRQIHDETSKKSKELQTFHGEAG